MVFAVLDKKKILIAISIILSCALLVTFIGGTGAYNVFYGNATRQLPIYRVKTEDKKVAISFDCAWGVDFTDKLLSIMQEENVKCTFFAVEFWSKKHPDYLKKIAEFGHEIGTHSATHPYMSKLEKTAIVSELTTSIKAIETVTDKKVELFRPPYGDYDDLLINTASELGLFTIQWDVDSLDWKNLSATEIYNRVISKVQNGSIVLFHNQGLHTAEALPLIIKELKKQGYQFVTIGELIYRDNYKMAVDGTQILCS